MTNLSPPAVVRVGSAWPTKFPPCSKHNGIFSRRRPLFSKNVANIRFVIILVNVPGRQPERSTSSSACVSSTRRTVKFMPRMFFHHLLYSCKGYSYISIHTVGNLGGGVMHTITATLRISSFLETIM